MSETLSAYLDGELDDAARMQVEAFLEQAPEARRLLAELRETQAMMRQLPSEQAPEGFAESVMAAAERQALLGSGAEARPARPSRSHWGPIRAAAAVLLLVTGAGSWIFWKSTQHANEVRVAVLDGSEAEVGVEREISETAAPRRNAPVPEGDLALYDRVASAAGAPESGQPGFGPASSGAVISSAAKAQPVEQGDKRSATEVSAATPDGKARLGMAMTATKLDGATGDAPQAETNTAGNIVDEATEPTDTEGEEIIELAASPGPQWGRFRKGIDASDSGQPPSATGDYVQQLADREPLDTISNYRFDQEQVVLTMSFANDLQRDQFRTKTLAFFAEQTFLNAVDPAQKEQITSPLFQNTFLAGHAGVNFDATDEQQILVSAPAAVLEELVDRYAQQAREEDTAPSVLLTAGNVQVKGVSEVQAVTRVLEIPDVRRQMLGQDHSAGRDSAGVGWMAGEDQTPADWEAYYTSLETSGEKVNAATDGPSPPGPVARANLPAESLRPAERQVTRRTSRGRQAGTGQAGEQPGATAGRGLQPVSGEPALKKDEPGVAPSNVIFVLNLKTLPPSGEQDEILKAKDTGQGRAPPPAEQPGDKPKG